MSSSHSPLHQQRDTMFGCKYFVAQTLFGLHHLTFVDSIDSLHPAFPQYPSPPPPAHGQALLDDAESSMLGDFFEKVSSSNFDNSFFNDKHGSMYAQNEMMFGWGGEEPPMFHGTTTSMPSQSMLSHNRDDSMNSSHMMISPASLPGSSTSKSTSLTAMQPHSHPHEEPLYGTHEVANILMGASGATSATATPRSSSNQLPNISNSTTEEIIGTINNFAHTVAPGHHEMDYFPAEVLRAQMEREREARPGLSRKPNLVWGSDDGFKGNGYVPPSDAETVDERKSVLMKDMECLLPVDANSTPPSPALKRAKLRKDRRESSSAMQNSDEEMEDAPRRRKSQNDEDDYDEKGRSRSFRGSISKVRSGRIGKSSDDSPPAKRRKSQASASQKAARENLTEAQKRENHIHSEQKRRNLIKQGFDDLCDLVPDLKGGGFSKSAVLVQSADWLEGLLKNNDELKRIIAVLEGKNGY
jgi:Helix-loop-helix DNA-binding domain